MIRIGLCISFRNNICPGRIAVSEQGRIGYGLCSYNITGMVPDLYRDPGSSICHVWCRSNRNCICNPISSRRGKSKRIVINWPVYNLVPLRVRTALRAITLGRGFISNLPAVRGSMRLTIFRLNRDRVICLIHGDFSVVVVILTEVDCCAVLNSDFFALGHGRECVIKSIGAAIVCIGSAISVYSHIIIED